jgi:hypothetical protein
MPSDVSGTYQLAGNGYIFADESVTRDEPTWYTIDTTVPFARRKSRSRQLQVSGHSPLFDVGHELRVAVTCTYDIPDVSDQATERLQFSIPLRFVHVPPTLTSQTTPSPHFLINSDSDSAPPSTEMLTRSAPYVPNLPAYSQLFDSNGDRKIDYSVPLPLYTPQLPSSTSRLQPGVAFGSCGGKPPCLDALNLLPEEDRPLLADISSCQD